MARKLTTESLTGLSNVVMGSAITAAATISGAILPSGSAQLAFGISGLFGTLGIQAQRDMDRVLARLRRKLEQDWEGWSGLAEVRDEGLRTGILQSLDEVLPLIRLTAEEIAAERLDAARLAELMVAKAAAALPAAFGPEPARGEEARLAREVLRNLGQSAFEVLTRDPGFADLVKPALWQDVLGQSDRIIAGQNAHDSRFDRLEQMLEQALRDGADGQTARDSGITEAALVALASRIAGEVTDGAQALRELESAVEIAIAAQANRGGEDAVLRSVAEASARGDHGAAAGLAEAELARMEAEHAARKTALLTAALDQDLLRRDPVSAARRVVALAGVEHSAGPDFAALRAKAIEWFMKGRDSGVALFLEVAEALAGEVLGIARTPEERVAALNLAGVVEHTFGERRGSARPLLNAISHFEEALMLISAEDQPDLWAKTQMNLANSTQALALRERGNDRLERAIAAYRKALAVRTREERPEDWARTQVNLAEALRALAEAEGRTDPLETALSVLEEALAVRTRDKDEVSWAVTILNRATSNRVYARLAGAPERLEMALADLDEAEAAFERAEAGYFIAECAKQRGLCHLATGGLAGLRRAQVALAEAARRFGADMSVTDRLVAEGHAAIAVLREAGMSGDAALAAEARAKVEALSEDLRASAHHRGAEALLAAQAEAQAPAQP